MTVRDRRFLRRDVVLQHRSPAAPPGCTVRRVNKAAAKATARERRALADAAFGSPAAVAPDGRTPGAPRPRPSIVVDGETFDGDAAEEWALVGQRIRIREEGHDHVRDDILAEFGATGEGRTTIEAALVLLDYAVERYDANGDITALSMHSIEVPTFLEVPMAIAPWVDAGDCLLYRRADDGMCVRVDFDGDRGFKATKGWPSG